MVPLVPVILLIPALTMPDVFVQPIKKSTKASKVTPPPSRHDNKPTPVTTPTNAVTNSVTIFSTFCQNPENVKLVGQDADEKIILFLRQDLVTNLTWILNVIIFALLPIFIVPLLGFADLSLDFLPTRFRILLFIFYYLLLAGYAFANFVTWFYTSGIISNKKFVDIDFHNLSSIQVGNVNLKDASDVKYRQSGFFQSFFDFGDIIITIEATKAQFIFERTPKPAEITDILSDLIGKK